VGDLVEVRGTINGDPLRQVIALMSAVALYLGWDLDVDDEKLPSRTRQTGAKRRGNQSTLLPQRGNDSETIRMFRILKADVAKSSVLDLKMTLDDGRHVVLAASNEYMTEAAEQYMLAGSFAALGKVTQVVKPGEKVSLLRRTIFSAIDTTGEVSSEEAFSGLRDSMPGLDLSSLAVAGPRLQVLPLAIYV
jgi:hypothetical protein